MSGLRGLAKKVLGESETPQQKKERADKKMAIVKLEQAIADKEIELGDLRANLIRLKRSL